MNEEFRKWAADEGLFFGDIKIEEHPITEWAWRAWKRATKIENEACAKACEAADLYNEDDPGESFAKAIRARMKP